ncbi:2-polyprenyl-3-methyl-5-hydroxy-6-metoxy-1,4-benzoquinol methylase [Thiohalorhabdus denitrificans]|uniref:Methyltransferase domain-containing protein n=1 Tax=Thiohalorhabdus denitrificans TaxID=381306 RepID=A0A0P9GI91_9GAMM|nr:class I SAM-dependent methyltransferase [Thiohalorhabdus denitrificans]KPV39711.1 2-polyprenyl-3-methyl-5-hydroxy-6-metoxy-1,4-benzoquinol methylase [Thiohalorhabdus denitrificans]SCX93010.1 Methyltransferase domain-containing protein [Thiohalorhabdus denitrificans]
MSAANMKIQDPSVTEVVEEADVYSELLPLDGARVIELGCGAAAHTRAIAGTGRPASVLACEVDEIQHGKNLEATDVPDTVTFARAGAEAIPAEDDSADVVLMFKSLHHVPVESMDQAMQEIRRVLRPGGVAYISEPVYAGDFNEVLRLFHDEGEVRRKAFEAVQRAVDGGVLELVEQRFFNTRNDFDDFADFEDKVLGVTHTEHNLSPELYEQVRETFEGYMGPDGAKFEMPIRVDLLRSPA